MCYTLLMRPIFHNCTKCGAEFVGRRVRKYCSRACHHADRPPSWNAGKRGLPGSRPRARVTKSCAACGGEFWAHRHRGASALYCSMRCYHGARWGGSRAVEKVCAQCGARIETTAARDVRFCSKTCYAAWQTANIKGARAPAWKGGTSKHYRRGYDWPEAAEAARKRDGYRCQKCGMAQAALVGARKRLDVHHIVPYSVSQSNALSNLVTLCRPCHGAAEPAAREVRAMRRKAKRGESFLPLLCH